MWFRNPWWRSTALPLRFGNSTAQMCVSLPGEVHITNPRPPSALFGFLAESIDWFVEDQAFLRSYDSALRPPRREHRLIYRGPSFLSAPRPPLSPLSRQQIVSLSQFVCRQFSILTVEGKGKKAWASINRSFNPLWFLLSTRTYICRVQNCVWRLPKYRPPTPLSTQRVCPSPAPKAVWVWGVGGRSIFWKTPDIGLASYSIISLRYYLMAALYYRNSVLMSGFSEEVTT